MINNYKIVCNTATGRCRYMQYLIPFVVANDIVYRYDLWINTINKQDIEFFQKEWKPDARMSEIDQTVQTVTREVEERKEEILAKPSIYPYPYLPQKKPTLRNSIEKWKIPLPKLYTLGQIKNYFNPENRKDTSYEKYIL